LRFTHLTTPTTTLGGRASHRRGGFGAALHTTVKSAAHGGSTTAESINHNSEGSTDVMQRLKEIHNGERVVGTFSDEEMRRRVTELRKVMTDNGVDAVVFTSYHNINYYSDFLYTSFGRNYALVVTSDSHVTVSANIDAGQPWRRSFGENIVYTDWQRDNFQHAIATVLANAGVSVGRLGVEDDNIPPMLRSQIAETLPKFELVDISTTAMAQRMLKSAEEIALIKEGARIADIGGAAVV